MRFDELFYREMVDSIRRAGCAEGMHVVSEVVIAEANVALCTFHGRRFNAKFDLAYGSSIEPVDRMTREEVARIEAIVVHHAELRS